MGELTFLTWLHFNRYFEHDNILDCDLLKMNTNLQKYTVNSVVCVVYHI